jgi:hypothetical protein
MLTHEGVNFFPTFIINSVESFSDFFGNFSTHIPAVLTFRTIVMYQIAKLLSSILSLVYLCSNCRYRDKPITAYP